LLLTNVFSFECYSETSTAADIVANISKAIIDGKGKTNNQENALSDKTSEEIAPAVNQSTNTEATPSSENASETQVSAEATKKKIGFVDQEGNILIAPDETIFPTDMQDGKIYYFSTDVDTLKENLKNQPQNAIMTNQTPVMPNGAVVNNQEGMSLIPAMTDTTATNTQAMNQNPMMQNGAVVNNPAATQNAKGTNGALANTQEGMYQIPAMTGVNNGSGTDVANTEKAMPQGESSGAQSAQPAQNGVIPDINGKKPIMFQCYLA
jgi:hypothetical protein